MSKASEHQPPPSGAGTRVLDAVLQDLKDRAEAGKKKYGVYLQTNNGRDALWDAYQEALDLVMYLRQCLLEKEEAAKTPAQKEDELLKAAVQRALLSPHRNSEELLFNLYKEVTNLFVNFKEVT